MSKISIVIPCYNTEGNIPALVPVLLETEKTFPEGTVLEYIFVDDGSQDKTLEVLKAVKKEHPDKVKVIKLSRNFGANGAALAGVEKSTGDCCTILAADLQDPPELIPKMFEYWQKGIKLVVANREKREDSINIKFFSWIYHVIMQKSMPLKVPPGGFDLILFDHQVREELVALNEKNAYIPYLLMWLGFDYVNIPYTRRKREIGKSQWTLSKKIKAAIDSIVAFSFSPIRIISMAGLFLGLCSLVYTGMIIYHHFTNGNPVEGWSSLMVVFLTVSSFQMIALGVIGEYVWRTLDSSRRRPNYVIDQVD